MSNGDNTISISVTNNFTTDLTYRVDVTNMTMGSSEHTLETFSMSGRNKQFFSQNNPGACDIFSFTVTPTAMEMEGKSSDPVPGFFTAVTGKYTVSVFVSVTGKYTVSVFVEYSNLHRW